MIATACSILGVGIITAGVAGASVTTNGYVYQAGDTVHIAVNGMQPGESVVIDVSYPDGTTAQTHTIAADASGGVADTYVLPLTAPSGIYAVTATGQSSGVTFSTTFDPKNPGSLDCPTLTPFNNTHYGLTVGTTVTCTIVNATDLPAGTTSTTVFIKSSVLGNTEVTGSVSGTTITFTYTAPAGGCDTTNVAYYSVGNDANNAIINPSGPLAAAGFAYLDGSGNVPSCGSVPPAADLTIAATATPSFDRTYTWGISKGVDNNHIDTSGSATANYTVTVTHDNGTDGNWQVNGTITVTNPNTFAVPGTTVTDTVDNGGTCTVSGGTNATIAAGPGGTNFAYTCTYTSQPSPLAGTDTAQVAWPDTLSLLANNATGTAPFDFSTAVPTIHDGSVVVTDTLGGPLGTVSYTDPSPTSFTYPITFTDPAGTCTTHDNTATLTTSDSHTTGSASQSVTVCVGANLQVTKNVTPGFSRSYTWDISKAVDNSHIDTSGPATANYTVTVTHDGGTDGNWHADGTISVKNPNDWEAITPSNLSDAINNGGSCTVGALTPSTIPAGATATASYHCAYGAAPNPSDFTNTATVTWDATAASTPDGTASGSATGSFSSVSPTIVDGSVTVTDSQVGILGTVSYTDPSPTTLHYSVTYSDRPGTCTTHDNTATFVTSDTHTTGSASQSVTVCVGADLAVSKTANPSFTRTYTWGIAKAVDHSVIHTAGSASATYTVSVTHDGGADSNWQVNGTITVSNPNDWESVAVGNLADAIDNGGICTVGALSPSATIAPLGSATAPYTCTYGSAPSPAAFTNTATATWDANAASTPDGSATGTATGAFGAPTTIIDGSVTVTDSLGGTLGTVSYTDPSPTTFTYPITFVDPAGTCTTHPNTATFVTSDTHTTGSAGQSVTVCVGADLAVSKTATPSFTRQYTWGIAKSVDNGHINTSGSATANYTVSVTHDNGTDSNWQVNGVITVANPNDWESVAVGNLADSIDNGGICTVGALSPSATIAPLGSATASYTCTYASAPSPSAFTNTATATWDANAASTPDGSATGTATGAFGAPTTIVDGSVTVTDSIGGTLGTVSYTDPSPTTFTYPITFNDPAGTCTPHPNTATFVTSDTHTTGSASQSVTVCVGADLKVTKTANPSFTRTYKWSISKSVDKTLVQQSGGSATFNYTVKAAETGFTDSNWQVSGVITVTNPNNWESITPTNVSDAINNGGICTVGTLTPATIPANGSATASYTCTYSSAPSPAAFTNTATATWNASTAFTPDGSASGAASGAFGAPTSTVNKTVTIVDPLFGTSPLGTLTATDTMPYTSATYTYSKTVPVPTNDVCTVITNTASIRETGQSASTTVTVCGAVNGGLTMGFWHNNNGQAIIKGDASTSGVCHLTTWLRQYAPFQDLSATASCSQVASYFLTVFNAANASGSSMNAMLKAQMLATALDVYFSTPSLGGNKINSPAPLGGVVVDLTKVCSEVDSSSGTGTCTGTLNASAAFGGATSMTISQMLAYAASQSNAGGTTWYGQNKTTQGLAKNAFDSINNGAALVI